MAKANEAHRLVIVPDQHWDEVNARLHSVDVGPIPTQWPGLYGLIVNERPERVQHKPTRPTILHPREWQALCGMRRGLSTVEIGKELALGQNTVKTYVQRMYRKLGVNERAAAVAFAYENGWFVPENDRVVVAAIKEVCHESSSDDL